MPSRRAAFGWSTDDREGPSVDAFEGQGKLGICATNVVHAPSDAQMA